MSKFFSPFMKIGALVVVIVLVVLGIGFYVQQKDAAVTALNEKMSHWRVMQHECYFPDHTHEPWILMHDADILGSTDPEGYAFAHAQLYGGRLIFRLIRMNDSVSPAKDCMIEWQQ